MEPFGDLECVLKVNPHCNACKMKMMEVLSSIIGVYSVSMDAPSGLVKISGEVDPNMVLEAIAKTGKHAEVVWTKLNHPRFRKRYNSHKYIDYSDYGYGYGPYGNNIIALEDPYYAYHQYCPMRREVPRPALEDPYYAYHLYCPMRREVPRPEYYYPQYYINPPARYVPSYPPPPLPEHDYNPYDNYESISLCSIM